jgi:predicted membrane protein
MSRAISLLLAVALSVALMLLPAMRGRDLDAYGHALLTPLLLSICGGFVHGLGYVSHNRFLRRVLHPLLLWPAMAGLGVAWRWLG